eukprot:scaffold9429_cov71-Cyclotella_meneghiniana.AAC.3
MSTNIMGFHLVQAPSFACDVLDMMFTSVLQPRAHSRRVFIASSSQLIKSIDQFQLNSINTSQNTDNNVCIQTSTTLDDRDSERFMAT